MVAAGRDAGAGHALVEGVGGAGGPVHHTPRQQVVVGGELNPAVQLARVLLHN